MIRSIFKYTIALVRLDADPPLPVTCVIGVPA
jgi:hypothetical protein